MHPERSPFVEHLIERLTRPRVEYSLLAACLGAMHLVSLLGPATAAGRMFMLAHLGLFLLWQPVVRGAYRPGWRNVLAMLLVIGGLTLFLDWALLAVWVVVLASVISGAAFSSAPGRGRLSYRLALIALITSLLLVVLPRLVPVSPGMADVFDGYFTLVLPCLIAAIALVPGSGVRPQVRGVDFVSAMLMFLVLTILVLGALVLMWLVALPYLVAIIVSLFAMAGGLAIMAWAWDPRMGGPQLGAQLMRRILSAGMSFEEWLHGVAALSEAHDEPLEFLAQACERLMQLPGVRGGRWRVPAGEGEFGQSGGLVCEKGAGALKLSLALESPPTPAMDWHLDLVVRLLGQFYQEKMHARELEALSYVRAVHETGARLTHDVKNLLQSLNTLCFTATQPDTDAATIKALASRQLPVIARRLAATLDKLRVPDVSDGETVAMTRWWSQAQERFAGSPVVFPSRPDEAEVPQLLFDTALDHLVQNALSKQRLDPSVSVTVRAGGNGGAPWLEVEDTGARLRDAVRAGLFTHPVPSEDGLGMGLYQLHRLAGAGGFRLTLVQDEDGCVLFRLAQADSAED